MIPPRAPCAAVVALAGCADLLGIGDTDEVVVWEDDHFDDLRDGPLAGQNGWTALRCGPEVQSGSLRLTPIVGDLCQADKSVPVQTDGRHRLTARVRVTRFATDRDADSLARIRLRTEPFIDDDKTLQIYLGRSIRASYFAGDEIHQPMIVQATELATTYELRVDLDLSTGDVAIAVDDVEGATFRMDATTLDGLSVSGWNRGGEVYVDDLRGIGGL